MWFPLKIYRRMTDFSKETEEDSHTRHLPKQHRHPKDRGESLHPKGVRKKKKKKVTSHPKEEEDETPSHLNSNCFTFRRLRYVLVEFSYVFLSISFEKKEDDSSVTMRWRNTVLRKNRGTQHYTKVGGAQISTDTRERNLKLFWFCENMSIIEIYSNLINYDWWKIREKYMYKKGGNEQTDFLLQKKEEESKRKKTKIQWKKGRESHSNLSKKKKTFWLKDPPLRDGSFLNYHRDYVSWIIFLSLCFQITFLFFFFSFFVGRHLFLHFVGRFQNITSLQSREKKKSIRQDTVLEISCFS